MEASREVQGVMTCAVGNDCYYTHTHTHTTHTPHTHTNTENTYEEVINTNGTSNTCSCFINRSSISGYRSSTLQHTPTRQLHTSLPPSLRWTHANRVLLRSGQTTYSSDIEMQAWTRGQLPGLHMIPHGPGYVPPPPPPPPPLFFFFLPRSATMQTVTAIYRMSNLT